MSDGAFVPSLFLMTLIAGLVIAGIAFAYFMRKRSNRHPMDTPAGKAAEDSRRRDAERDRETKQRPDLS